MAKILSKKIKYTKSAQKYLAVFLLAAVLLPVSPARAWLGGGGNIIGTIKCTLDPIDCTLNFVRSFLVNLITLIGSGLKYALSLKTANAIVTSSWGIVRNFANMFFILALIIMAFATIFNVGALQKYNFSSLIARFLVAVLLINFSLVIGEIIIDWSQSLSNVFLDAIGDVGARIAQGANIAKNLDAGTIITAPVDQVSWTETMKAGINIIMLAIIFFSLLVLLVFAVIRVPILWALLIVSPIAWITYILPTTMDVNRRWWKYFIGWNVFMPIYLFFIYFGVLFLNNQDKVLADFGSTQLSGFDYSFQFIFFYILIAIFLIGGAKFAMSSSMAAGAGGVAAGIWAKGRATARFAGAMPYRVGKYGVGIGWRASGAAGAYKEAKEHIQKEGFVGTPLENMPIIGGYRGQRGLEERQAKIAGALGIPGVAEKQTQRKIQAAEEKFKNKRLSEGDLNGILGTGRLEEKIAASNMLKNLGQNIKGEDLAPIFDEYRKISPAEAVRWIRGQNIENLSRDGLDALEKVADPQLRQKVSRIKAKRSMIADADTYEALIKERFDKNTNEQELVGLIGDSKEFIDGLKKDEVNKILEAIPKEFIEARKKLVMQVAEKGFFDAARLEELAGANRDASDNGVFGSASEADKFLDLAKKSALYEALALKEKRGTLRDAYDKDSDGKPVQLIGSAGIDKALRQEFDKMDTEGLTKIRSDNTKKTGFANDVVLRAFQDSLNANPRGAEKVKGMYLDPKFYNNAPLIGYLDDSLKKVRLNAFMKDMGDPFKAKVLNITDVLIPEINKAKEEKNDVVMREALERARGSLKQAEGQLSKITNLEFIGAGDTEAFANLLANAKAKFRKVEEEIKLKKGGKKNDNEPPPDDDPEDGGKKGGGGSNGGGSSRGGTPPLGPGERLSKGGIILTPGAQYEMRRSRPQTPPPAESESRVGGTSIPFSSKTGTIPSGEIGKPIESKLEKTTDTTTHLQGLNEEEIKQASNRAGQYKNIHGRDVETLMIGRAGVDPEIGKRFQAHGIAKGFDADQLRSLNKLLSEGISNDKRLYTTNLRLPDKDEQGIAGAVGASGPYDSGGVYYYFKTR